MDTHRTDAITDCLWFSCIFFLAYGVLPSQMQSYLLQFWQGQKFGYFVALNRCQPLMWELDEEKHLVKKPLPSDKNVFSKHALFWTLSRFPVFQKQNSLNCKRKKNGSFQMKLWEKYASFFSRKYFHLCLRIIATAFEIAGSSSSCDNAWSRDIISHIVNTYFPVTKECRAEASCDA